MRPLSIAPDRTSSSRPALVTAVVAALVLVAGCASAAPTATPAARAESGAAAPVATDPTGSSCQAVAGMPAVAAGNGSGSGQGASTAAIAYPYPVYGGAPGLAPDQTIVVSGTGTATLKDASADRSAAERSALTAALADARAQAEIVASASSVKLGAIVSVSVASSGGWVAPVPMESGSGASSGTGGASTGPASTPEVGRSVPGGAPTIVAPASPGTTSIQLVVTVTVAYHFS